MGALGDALALGKIQRDAMNRELEKLCVGGESSACSHLGAILDDARNPSW